MKNLIIVVMIFCAGHLFGLDLDAQGPGTWASGNFSKMQTVDGMPEVWVSARESWFDTGRSVNAGTNIMITASGSITWCPLCWNAAPTVGPDGTRLPYPQDKDRFPMPDAGCGSLVLKVGDSIYWVGERNTITTTSSGNILLMVNDDDRSDNSGGFLIRLNIPNGGGGSAVTLEDLGKMLLGSNYQAVTQEYDVYYEKKKGYHTGIDYRARTPLPVYSPVAGVVDSFDPKGTVYGRVAVKIERTNDYFLFLHLSEPMVTKGKDIKVGDLIGLTGSTGVDRQPHLHVEVRTGRNTPAAYFPAPDKTGVNKDPSSVVKSEVAPMPTSVPQTRSQIRLNGWENWHDTRIVVKRGQTLNISATGQIIWNPNRENNNTTAGPDGVGYNAYRLQQPEDFPMPEENVASLIMKIGNVKYAIGSRANILVKEDGFIQLMINDRYNGLADNSGDFAILIVLGSK